MINNIKVLIVEDNFSERLLIFTYLKNMGIENILEADNGKSAIQICQDNPDIDIIFMNINMPIMNGDSATIEIRKFNNKVIIIGNSTFNLFEIDESVKFNDYMVKPIIFDQIYNIIKKYFFI
jgi:CheY-like chemotaxis protein